MLERNSDYRTASHPNFLLASDEISENRYFVFHENVRSVRTCHRNLLFLPRAFYGADTSESAANSRRGALHCGIPSQWSVLGRLYGAAARSRASDGTAYALPRPYPLRGHASGNRIPHCYICRTKSKLTSRACKTVCFLPFYWKYSIS